jgi:subtilisin family serine protease
VARLLLDGRTRESIDPDDYTGHFAVWSGTSFAAPVLAGQLATLLANGLAADASRRPAVAIPRANAAIAQLPQRGVTT